MQMKPQSTPVTPPAAPPLLDVSLKKENKNCCRDCEDVASLTRCLWEFKMAQLQWKAVQGSLKLLNIGLPGRSSCPLGWCGCEVSLQSSLDHAEGRAIGW